MILNHSLIRVLAERPQPYAGSQIGPWAHSNHRKRRAAPEGRGRLNNGGADTGACSQHCMARSLLPPARILPIMQRLHLASVLYHPEGLDTTSLSQGCVLGAACSVGKAGRTHVPRAGRGEAPLTAQVQLKG